MARIEIKGPVEHSMALNTNDEVGERGWSPKRLGTVPETAP